jgi:alpha-D-xyloside xylohydrolase
LNFCAAGEPYWNLDIGGFFIKNDPAYWFWRGDYDAGCRGLTDGSTGEPDPNDTGCTDLGYWELYTRWLQYAVFLPMFRSHGTDAPREAWRFGEPGTPFYDAIVQYIQLRYRLSPYIYSVAAQVSLNSWTIIRAMALDFPRDLRTHGLTDQYMFGPGLMACPVTKPMYYDRNSEPIAGAEKSRPVYLPSGAGWYDFWTEAWFPGGGSVEAPAPLEVIPVFARAGAIVPMSPVMQYADEMRDAAYEIRVYRGADGVFPLYEDEGDNYNYERGRFSMVTLRWDEARGELIVAARTGEFDGMVTSREFHIVFISDSGREWCNVVYRGEEIRVRPGAGETRQP